MSEAVKGLIVGGGPSGLSVAYAFGGPTVVLEKEAKVGGLCRSITRDGGVFDIGGHSFHTPHPEVNELVDFLLKGKLYRQQRDARVTMNGALIPYPFQKHFDQLPDAAIVKECEEGLRKAEGNASESKNFEDYIIRKFGQGIAGHFMLPYNRKLWARDIKNVSCEWTGERVAGARGEKESFDTRGGQRKPLQSDTKVAYPEQGGFEEIYSAFVPHLPDVRVNQTVVHIDSRRRRAATQSGRILDWEFMVSTMPLPELLRIIEGAPRELIELADRLEFMSLRVELLRTKGRLDTPIQRVYCSDPAMPPHKIALNHNSSDFLRQQPCHAIMAEVSVSPDKVVDVHTIAPKTIGLLCDLKILRSPDDVAWTGHVDVHYAYPVYTADRPGLVGEIKDWLRRHHIYTAGRFGDWEYVNSDKCVAKGLGLGHELRNLYEPAVSSHVVQAS